MGLQRASSRLKCSAFGHPGGTASRPHSHCGRSGTTPACRLVPHFTLPQSHASKEVVPPICNLLDVQPTIGSIAGLQRPSHSPASPLLQECERRMSTGSKSYVLKDALACSPLQRVTRNRRSQICRNPNNRWQTDVHFSFSPAHLPIPFLSKVGGWILLLYKRAIWHRPS